MSKEFYKNICRDLGVFKGKLQNETQDQVLDYLSQVGMVQHLLGKIQATPIPSEHANKPIIWIKPQLFGFVKGNQWKEVVTQRMYIADSSIPSMKKWGASGVLFAEDTAQGIVCCVYGGPVCTREYALESSGWTTTYRRSDCPQKGGFVHDRRVTKGYPIGYYTENGLAGSILNYAAGSGKGINIAVCFYDSPYRHPNGEEVDGVCVFVTTRACKAGEEALCYYGPMHCKCHFNLLDKERCSDIAKAEGMPPPPQIDTELASLAQGQSHCFVIEPFSSTGGEREEKAEVREGSEVLQPAKVTAVGRSCRLEPSDPDQANYINPKQGPADQPPQTRRQDHQHSILNSHQHWAPHLARVFKGLSRLSCLLRIDPSQSVWVRMVPTRSLSRLSASPIRDLTFQLHHVVVVVEP
eukprot:327559-Rhodomonas_salina.1